MAVARKFYEETLGLRPVGSEGDELIVYLSGNTTLNVYKSDEAGTKATMVTWRVGKKVEELVRTLKGKGVAFEHYDMPGLTLECDIKERGLDLLCPVFNVLDLTPQGRGDWYASFDYVPRVRAARG